MSERSIPLLKAETPHWTARFGKSIIFMILTLVCVGIFLARNIPVAVFPDTDFPRVVVGVDNGVMPIDQMLVTITKPLEESLNSVQGLKTIWSITSRGTAEIDLFFDWSVDMYRTLELVNAALARAQSSLPSTAKITASRLTFAAFPVIGYSMTSDTVPQTDLWELANYEIKPRLNRQPGVSTVVVQGGKVPEFQVQPDPAKQQYVMKRVAVARRFADVVHIRNDLTAREVKQGLQRLEVDERVVTRNALGMKAALEDVQSK